LFLQPLSAIEEGIERKLEPLCAVYREKRRKG